MTTNKKASNWWIGYHFWAGTCLFTYTSMSGFNKYIVQKGSGLGSGLLGESVGAGVLAIAALAIGYSLSKSLILFIDEEVMSSKVRIIIKSILPIAYFLILVLLAAATAPIFSIADSYPTPASSTSHKSSVKPVVAATTIQSSEGLTEADLNQVALDYFEKLFTDMWVKKTQNHWVSNGGDLKDPKIVLSPVAKSVYVELDGKKLAIIKITMNDSVRMVVIIGLKKSELYRVTCARSSNHDIPVSSGVCGEEVSRTFGIRFPIM